MAFTKIIVLALLVAVATAQMPVQGFFNVPAALGSGGGRVNFAGLSLGQVCKQIMMLGGKEALSDGMGAASKWFATQKIAGPVAGGTDPQMQCLYSQATGSMMPGMLGTKDPGNMFGDYYDTVIEYPMILDPCTAPQCNGKVNPTALLMQAYAPMMRSMGMGMGMPGMNPMGGMPGMNPMGGMPGMNPMGGNPFANNPLLSALMPKPGTGTALARPNGTQAVNTPSVPATSMVAAAPAPTPTQPPANPFGQMMNMFQNPQMMQMFQQFMMQQMPNAGMNPAASPAPANPFAALAGGMNGFPGFGLGSLFL